MPRFDDRAVERLASILATRPALDIDAPQYRRAAVLAPFLRTADGWSLVFTRRSASLPAHSGQISFPGGGVEPGESLRAAALREAEEEIGIPPASVRIIGRLDDLVTNSGFLVAPYVGVVDTAVDYVIQPSEVEEVFEVPVEALLTPGLPEVRYVAFRSKNYPAYYYPYGRWNIWGLTGRMLKALLDLVWQAV